MKDEFGKASVDLEKFCQKLVAGRKLIRSYYYNATLPQGTTATEKAAYESQQKFLDKIRRISYFELRLGRLEHRPNGAMVEKGVDIKIAVDMLKLAHNNVYDTAILVSGDGDFADAVQAVKDMGKHVENASPRAGQSFHLKQTCDRFIAIDGNFLNDLWL
ncbi:MAG: hypothetical protein A2Z03_03985 [Chloroflexi bacterium RBG_16_56_8]|nr:MAG: hypothetical protein A2Z03_03985 [Chloroflexi bacterium RBG_16_56_8]